MGGELLLVRVLKKKTQETQHWELFFIACDWFGSVWSLCCWHVSNGSSWRWQWSCCTSEPNLELLLNNPALLQLTDCCTGCDEKMWPINFSLQCPWLLASCFFIRLNYSLQNDFKKITFHFKFTSKANITIYTWLLEESFLTGVNQN